MFVGKSWNLRVLLHLQTPISQCDLPLPSVELVIDLSLPKNIEKTTLPGPTPLTQLAGPAGKQCPSDAWHRLDGGPSSTRVVVLAGRSHPGDEFIC